MSEYRPSLERIRLRVPMPEPAMERMLRRRDRTRRNQRIATVLTALVIAVAGIGGAILALRERTGTKPASGPSSSPVASGGGGWVGIAVPTVAIWLALALLGLVIFAIVRLPRLATARRPRPGRGGTPTGAPEAPGHGPGAEPRAALNERRNEMDSKEKTGFGVPQVTVPPAARDELRTARVNRWLVGAVIVLAAGVIALGVALIAQSGNAATPSKIGLADAATVKMIDAFNKAASTDGQRLASFFTPNGVMDEVNIDEVTTGRAAIARHMQGYIDTGFQVEGFGPVIQSGSYVAQATTASGSTSVIAIYELTSDGEISHMWAIAD